MKQGGTGGSNTKTGSQFENEVMTKLLNYLTQNGYSVEGDEVKKNHISIASFYKQRGFYKFLQEYVINWDVEKIPDIAIYVKSSKTLFIIECKNQNRSGSTDEKIATGHFYKWLYNRLPNMKVEYIYFLNDWFKNTKYKTILEYNREIGVHYFFDNQYQELIKLLGLSI